MDKFPRTVGKMSESYRGLKPRGDGSIDVTGQGLTDEKVPYFRAFRAFCRQSRGAKMTAKIALSEHINHSGRRVE